MKTIITVNKNGQTPDNKYSANFYQTSMAISTLNKALIGLVMSSVFVVANAADNSTPNTDSFSIRFVEKESEVRSAIAAPKTQYQTSHNQTVQLNSGGVIWTTSDPIALTPLLDVTTRKNIRLLANNTFDSPISFTLNTNYAAFIHSWTLDVYRTSDEDERRPLKRLTGAAFSNGHKVMWNGDVTSGERLAVGDQLKYVLTVKNRTGQSDVTRARQMTVQGSNRYVASAKSAPQGTSNNLERQTIPLYGSRVRIYGRDIVSGSTIAIDGENASVSNNRFVVERILPQGRHSFEVTIAQKNTTSYKKTVSANVNRNHLFMVGLVDITAGQGTVSGNLETLSDGDKYLDGDIFVDGRIAFYLKGKIKGKYLITAQMDTGTADIETLFDDIHKKDPQSVFKRLDPDKYYPVYGDDSTIKDDTNSQGKVYVRLDWNKSRATWGNYNTGMTGTELSSFNRSLYGAKYNHKSIGVTKSGDHKVDLKVFGSEAQSASRHNQFLGTGGSLYYLKDTDIVDGSEKVWVEVRDADSDRTLETIAMEEGRDYQIDDFQGRIILNRPLLQIAQQSNLPLVKDSPLDGDQLFLMVDYEYVPDDFESDKASYGARGKAWLGNHLAIGGSYAHENRNDDDYNLQGLDITLKKSKGTYLAAEYAQTEATQTAGSFTSLDGGLNFDDLISSSTLADKAGAAYSVEARVNLQDFSNKKGTVAAWYKNREAGFSSGRIDQTIASINTGLDAVFEPMRNLKLSAKVEQVDKEDVSKTTTASLQGDLKLGSMLTIGAEVRQILEEDQTGSTNSTDGEGTLAAVKLGLNVGKRASLYVIGQQTVEQSGTYESNDLVTVGAKANLTRRFAINAEHSSGDRGEATVAGLDYKLNDSHSFYTNYTLGTDSTLNRRNTVTVGQRKGVSNRLKVFNEHQFTREAGQSGLGHSFGVDYDYSKNVTLSSSVQTASLETDTGSTTDREAFSAGLTFKSGKSNGRSKVEYRRDQNDSVTDAKNTEQFVSTNSLHYQVTPSLRLQGKLNHSVTIDQVSSTTDATFTEAGLGFAYRPSNNDKLNVLGRLNYVEDLQPESQSMDADERSFIASLESTYQLNQRWQIGNKLAHRQSQVRSDRDTGTWTENDATVAAARVTYHLSNNWDAMAAYHWMNSDASEDSQHGAMVSIDRHIGKNFKVGIGYNFTQFNDDLSNTEGDAGGWFFNLVGKY